MDQRYETLDSDAGKGAFGIVRKARDNHLERQVAIKSLNPIFKVSPTEDDKERFRREAKILAALSHPNIPAVYDVIFDDTNEVFEIIFEWIEGTNVRKFLQDRGTMSLEEARKWFSNICGALGHAHDKGIIHRDIKPSNIIITTSLQSCYVVDFGVSLRSSDVKRLTNGTPIGTPGYMSPEQERGEELDAASDIYSLGIVLYECLSGIKPAVGEYTSLNSVNEAIPPAIDELIQSCLREREYRLESVRRFIESLELALEPHTSFSDVLSKGSLHEIQLALGRMSATEFARLPKGQRVLVFSRLRDLFSVDEAKLRSAVAYLLTELVRVAYFASDENYTLVVQNALKYGFEVTYSQEWQGNNYVRDSLCDVALQVENESHAIVSEQLLQFIESQADLSSKPRWYFHDLRVLLQNLLANPHCADAHADSLGERLQRINEMSH